MAKTLADIRDTLQRNIGIVTAPLTVGDDTVDVEFRVPLGREAEELHRAVSTIGQAAEDLDNADSETRQETQLANMRVMREWGTKLFRQLSDSPLTPEEVELVIRRIGFPRMVRVLVQCAGLDQGADDFSIDRS